MRGRYRRRRGGRRHFRVTRRLKRYVHNAITKRLPAKQFYQDFSNDNMQSGVLYTWTVGQEIVKGTDRGDRIGDSIDLKGLKIRFTLVNNNNNVPLMPLIRIMLLRNREPHDAVTNNLFKGEGGATYLPDSFDTTGNADQIWKPLNRKKYAVIFDKKIKLHPQNSESMGKWQRDFTTFVPLKYKIKYNPEADAGTFDFLKPNIMLAYFVERRAGTPTVNPSNISFTFRTTTYFRG